jgi:hypothetical protein
MPLEPGPDRPGLAVQFPIGEVDLFVLSVDKVDKTDIVRLAAGAMTKQLHQVRWPEERSW